MFRSNQRDSTSSRPTEFRWTLFWILLLCSALICALGLIYPEEYVAIVGIGSVLLGGAGGVMKIMASPPKPEPDPIKHQGYISPRGVAVILVAAFGPLAPAIEGAASPASLPAPRVRTNMLMVLFIGVCFVLFLALFLVKGAAVAIIALANALVGYAITAVIMVVSPPKPDPDPEVDEGATSPSGTALMLRTARDLMTRNTDQGTQT